MAALLSPSHIALIAQGVSAIVASRNADLLPSIMRAIGTQISPDGQLITVFLRASQSAQLLADIATCGPIAVVFSDPASNRTVQVKSGSARIRPATPGDQAVLRRYLLSLQHLISQVGYGPDYVAAMLSAPAHDVVALEFTPEAAFDQTPGPHAGTPLPSRP